MKHFILALVIALVSLSSFAFPHPGRGHHGRGPVVFGPHPHPGPMPHPHPGPMPHPYPHPVPGPMPRMCQVVMVDRMNMVVRRYNAYRDWNGMCREGLRACNWDLQTMGAWGYRCATTGW